MPFPRDHSKKIELNDMKMLVLITLHSIKPHFNIYCYQFITYIIDKWITCIGIPSMDQHTVCCQIAMKETKSFICLVQFIIMVSGEWQKFWVGLTFRPIYSLISIIYVRTDSFALDV